MLYAWEVLEPETNEWNIIAATVGALRMTPLVTTRRGVAESLRLVAETHGRRESKPVRLMSFVAFEDVT